MEFRTIKYMRKKDINIDNTIVSDEALANYHSLTGNTEMVLRLMVDDNNKVHIEYMNKISINNIREACKINMNEFAKTGGQE